MIGKRGSIPITCQNPDCAYYLIEDGTDILKMVIILLETSNTIAIIAENIHRNIEHTVL